MKNEVCWLLQTWYQKEGEVVTRKSQKKGREEIYIPHENAITKKVYLKQLKEAGFEIVTAFSIAPYVYAGARKYFYARAFGRNVEQSIKLKEKEFLSSKGPKYGDEHMDCLTM